MDLQSISYKNGIGYSKKSFGDSEVATIVKNIEVKNWEYRNLVIADPFYFEQAEKVVDQGTSNIS